MAVLWSVFALTPVRAVDTPMQAEAEVKRLFREFVDVFVEESKPSPRAMAGLVRDLNGLTLYLWDELAQEMAQNRPLSSAAQRQHRVLAAATAMQMILSAGLLNESADWNSLKQRASQHAQSRELMDLDALAPTLGALAAFVVTDLNAPPATGGQKP